MVVVGAVVVVVVVAVAVVGGALAVVIVLVGVVVEVVVVVEVAIPTVLSRTWSRVKGQPSTLTLNPIHPWLRCSPKRAHGRAGSAPRSASRSSSS